jgi:hypothetical protein
MQRFLNFTNNYYGPGKEAGIPVKRKKQGEDYSHH